MLRACDRLLGHGDGVAGLRLLDAHPQVQAGQQLALGVGYFGAQCDLAGGGIDRQVSEQQLAGLGVFRSIPEHQLDAGSFGVARAFELAAFHRAAQLEDIAGRLGEVHIHGVNLLHHGERGGFALPDQGAFGHQRPANAARNGRGHVGIAQVDVGGAHRCLGGRHVGLCLLFGSFGVHEILLADGVGAHQRAIAFDLGAGLGEVGLGLGEAGAGAFCCCGVGRWVNAEQGLACLDVTAFLEQPLLQDAGRAGSDLCHARGLDAAGQLGYQPDIPGRCSDHADFHGRHLGPTRRRFAIGFAAGNQEHNNGTGRHKGECFSAVGRGKGRDDGCVTQFGHESPFDRRQEMGL